MTMEPNKMEEEFRKKLNKREIQPSEAAWDRLDAMLSVAENKKPKPNFRWLYVAAGLAVFFTVGFFLFTQVTKNKEVVPVLNDGIVITEPSVKSKTIKEDSEVITSLQVQQGAQQKTVAANHRKAEKKSSSGHALKPSELPKQVVKEEAGLALQQEVSDYQKVNTDAEKLLGTTNLPKEKPQVKVNANSLLSSVEGELNQEFRESTLLKIKKNFKTVKTAVANRNYE